MGDSVRIERLANGYEVTIRDPEIVKKNNSRGKDGSMKPWQDPEREFAFKTIKEVLDFLKANLEKALPLDEFSSSFDAAIAEEDD